MNRKDYNYGISRSSILVHGFHKSNDDRTSLIGSVVKIGGNIGDGNIVIRFLEKSGLQFEDVSYYGKQTDFIIISEKIWPFLLAMPSPVDRIIVASNQELCELIAALQLDSTIDVFHSKTNYKAIIKYAGPVEDMGRGYYLGLELLGRTQITKCDGSYAGKQYFSALPGTALFVSIDKIYPIAHYLASKSKRQHIGHYETQNIDLRPSRDTRNVEFLTEKPKPKITPKQDNEMDLIEIIGSWPGVVDNKVTIVEPLDRTTRNKSLNPVSHFITTKKISRPKSEISNAKIVNLIHSEPESRYEGPSLPDVDYDTPAISTPSLPSSHPTPTPTATSVTTPSGELLSVGTLVEVVTDISAPLYGVVRWLSAEGEIAGVELEEDHDDLPLVLTDGTHNNQRYFNCAPGRALFVPAKQCQRDSRFDDTPVINESKMFGQRDSPIVPGSVPPLSMPTEEDVLAVCGKFRGIQGHHNSCYLDATLFAMFTYTAVFDSLLFRPRASNDISQYEEVQRVLREEIVNPLRQQLYVRADRVMKLRTLLEELSSVSGLTSEEKDPEEFLNSLLAQILKAEPFLKLSSGQEAFHYQLFVEKDEGLALPSVQQLFEQSFLSSDIKLKEVPSCLIIQMPRFGKNFKMYPRILPSQLLDVTDIIENSPRQCTVCGSLATYECRECLDQCGVGLESIGFCNLCLDKAHAHTRRSSHAPRLLHIPQDFIIMAEHCRPPRLFMELFAVVCIETSHYVAFVKCGSGHNAPWCFFDSMADRKGEQHGYNIPEMVACPDVSTWLSDEGAVCRVLHDKFPHDKQLPEHARRLLCDAYICMYQSPDVMMYR